MMNERFPKRWTSNGTMGTKGKFESKRWPKNPQNGGQWVSGSCRQCWTATDLNPSQLELRPVEVTGYSLTATCPLAVERRSVSSPDQWDVSGTVLMSLSQRHLRLPPFAQGALVREKNVTEKSESYGCP